MLCTPLLPQQTKREKERATYTKRPHRNATHA
jgi:hypothetical protein